MANRVYIVYEGDQWLSRSSMEVKCISPTKEDAINKVLKNHALRQSDFPDDDDITPEEMEDEIRRDLELNGQTQGYTVNYHIQEMEISTWE